MGCSSECVQRQQRLLLLLVTLVGRSLAFQLTYQAPPPRIRASSIFGRTVRTRAQNLRAVSRDHHSLGTTSAAAAAAIKNSSNTRQQDQQLQHEDSSATLRTNSIVTVNDWHRQRRREMLARYGDQIAPLERNASSQWIGLPLLVLSCAGLLVGSVVSGSLPVAAVVLLGVCPGSILSLWQLQLSLHY